jgi:hypothetical protein
MEEEILQVAVLVALEAEEDTVLAQEEQEIVHQQVHHKEVMVELDKQVQVMEEEEVVLLKQERGEDQDQVAEMVLLSQLLLLVHYLQVTEYQVLQVDIFQEVEQGEEILLCLFLVVMVGEEMQRPLEQVNLEQLILVVEVLELETLKVRVKERVHQE